MNSSMNDKFLFLAAIFVGTLALVSLVGFLISLFRRGSRKRAAVGVRDNEPGLRRARPKGRGESFDQRFSWMIYRTQLGLDTEDALGLIAFSTVTPAALLYFWKEEPWLSFAGAVLGFVIPLLVFRILSGRYRKKLQQQLPDLFFMLARFLKTGATLPQALKEAEVDGMPPISKELANVNASIDLGLPVSRSLESTARRIQLMDFDAFVSAVSLSQISGGDLAKVLDRLASGSRDRYLFQRQFQALTARGRTTAFALAAAVPILLLIFFLLDSERFTDFMQSSFGAGLVAVAIILEIIGAIWIYRILKIDY